MYKQGAQKGHVDQEGVEGEGTESERDGAARLAAMRERFRDVRLDAREEARDWIRDKRDEMGEMREVFFCLRCGAYLFFASLPFASVLEDDPLRHRSVENVLLELCCGRYLASLRVCVVVPQETNTGYICCPQSRNCRGGIWFRSSARRVLSVLAACCLCTVYTDVAHILLA